MPFFDKSPLNYPANTANSTRKFELNRAPTSSDYKNFKLGDEWLDTSSDDWWKLCKKTTTSGTWRKLGGTSAAVEYMLPDSGTSPVVPDATNQMTLAGGTGITTVGSLNTVTWNLDADIAQQYTTDAGSAAPAANNLNILGGTGIDTSGAADTITIDASVDIANQYVTDSGTAVPAANSLSVLGGTGISTSGAAAVITIDASGDVASQYTTDAGTAVPAANNLNIVGGAGVTTSGAGSTVTINASGAVAQQNIVYVGKHGNDANNGLSIELAKLTFTAAIATASTMTPATVMCFDSGVYTENLTLVPDVYIDAENATLTGTILIDDDSSVNFKLLNVATGTTGITKSTGTGCSIIEIDCIHCVGTGNGIASLSGCLNVKARKINIENGTGVGNGTTNQINIETECINIAGTGNAMACALGGIIRGEIQRIQDSGAGGIGINAALSGFFDVYINQLDVTTGITIALGSSVVNYIGNSITTTTAYNIPSGSTLNLTVNTMTGAEIIAAGAVVNIYRNDVGVRSNQTFTMVNPETTNTHFQMTTSGERTMPLQPCFSSYLTTTIPNATGAGTSVNVIFDAEVFDQNNDYDTTTGLFTAPVTGRYCFESTILIGNISAAMGLVDFWLVTSNRAYYSMKLHPGNCRDTSNDVRFCGSFIADMDAGDTAYMRIGLFGGAGDTASITGTPAAWMRTRFGGYLLN